MPRVGFAIIIIFAAILLVSISSAPLLKPTEQQNFPTPSPAPAYHFADSSSSTPLLKSTEQQNFPTPSPAPAYHFTDSPRENLPQNKVQSFQENMNMPPCQGMEQLTDAPVDFFPDSYIVPLGNLNPLAGHVTPTDHMYVNIHPFQGSIADYPGPLFSLKSPGNATLLEIQKSEHTLFGKVTSDYRLTFSPCPDVMLFFDHVKAISPALQAILDKAGTPAFCGDNRQNRTEQKMCKYRVSSSLKNGQELGQVAVGFDFGGYDLRTSPLAFINRERTVGGPDQYFHTICPLDYFSPASLKKSLYQKIKNTSENAQGLPDCGTTMQDKPDTIQGNWYVPTSIFQHGIQPFDQMLSIVHSNTDPSLGAISIGGTIAPAQVIQFAPSENGNANYEPSKVTADGKIYCYQNTLFPENKRIILQLLDSKTLKIESQPGTCATSLVFVTPTTYTR